MSARTASVVHVLSPKWRALRHRLREERSEGGGKVLVLTASALAFWAAVFGVLYRVLRYFRGVEEIGPLLAAKLLGMVLLAFGSILLLSNIITALSTFFLARDLELLVAAPVDSLRLYLARLAETTLHSSWMVALMAVPILAAYGIVYDGGWLFPLFAAAIFLPFLVIPAVIGSALTLVLVTAFPARRTRDLLSVIAVGAAGAVILFFRVIRPEQLARPEGFRNLLDFLALLQTPTSPVLPSEWAAKALMGYLTGPFDALPIYLLATTAAAAVVLGSALHQRLYAPAFTRAQEGAERFVRAGAWQRVLAVLLRPAGTAQREFIIKDAKLFFRDTTQWSQLILLAVLVVVYVFNIRALPLFRGERVPFFFVSLVTFLNLGLAGFVLAAIAARFIFPAISLEGRQMWLLRSSPLDLGALLWSKYWTGTLPLLVLAVMLIGTTNVILKVSTFMMVVTVGTIILLTLAISALALAFGALYPQFDTANAAQIPTSFGGLVFMMTTVALLGLVIVLEAAPIYGYLRGAASAGGAQLTSGIVISLGAVALLCLGLTAGALRLGVRRLGRLDF
jgi:ABC-2 type transport system permease protein